MYESDCPNGMLCEIVISISKFKERQREIVVDSSYVGDYSHGVCMTSTESEG